MNRILLIAVSLMSLGVLWGGCGSSTQQAQEDSLANRQIASAQKISLRMTLVGFPDVETEASRNVNDVFDQVLYRYKQEHPGISFVLTITDDLPTPDNIATSNIVAQPDLALIPAHSLAYLVDQGGIEPLGARLSAEWLESFPEESLAQCYAADVIFAIPWLEAEKPEDDWLLISFALSQHKPEAVEVMKFLAADDTALERMSEATGLRPAKKGLAAE
ncbi:MAG: hypothetical protein GTO55_00630 [Armatimonadetes bacterium]|nr:hypothetical protein [Armatimonadota bacterium]NIM22793.1 hypothetical protein [Armatimonadota bacterium]NIM66660.1 hypothetical protein [Armatimonadota bacterium]NIM75212.1 hypothetical protein [Armatimonadota bacterium]NIN04853.1 hypothetical protein [Armatimonadota bacterium]